MNEENQTQTPPAQVQEQGTDSGAGSENVVADPSVRPETQKPKEEPSANPFETAFKQVLGEDLSAEEALKKLDNLNKFVGDQTVADQRQKADQYEKLVKHVAREQGLDLTAAQSRVEEVLEQAEYSVPAPQQPATQETEQPQVDLGTRKELKKLQRTVEKDQLLKKYPEAEAHLDVIEEDFDVTGKSMVELFEKKYKPAIELGVQKAHEAQKAKEEQVQPTSPRVAVPEPSQPRNWQEALQQRVTDKLFEEKAE